MEITLRVEILVLIGVVLFILFGHTIASCFKYTGKEGFRSRYSTDLDARSQGLFSLTSDKPVDTTNWSNPNLTYSNGQSPGPAAQSILARQTGEIPLPEGEMLMFANTGFKPECCPNTYSNSMGCACMSVGQYSYLSNRGGNNVPYSEYR
jgi:hypothetical protein